MFCYFLCVFIFNQFLGQSVWWGLGHTWPRDRTSIITLSLLLQGRVCPKAAPTQPMLSLTLSISPLTLFVYLPLSLILSLCLSVSVSLSPPLLPRPKAALTLSLARRRQAICALCNACRTPGRSDCRAACWFCGCPCPCPCPCP
jgi:hypothetical protein